MTSRTAACQTSLSDTVSRNMLKLMSIESVIPSISYSVVCFSSCLQSFPASGSFPVSQLFASGSPSIGALASTSFPPVNIQGWFPLGLIDWFDLLTVQGTLIESSPALQFESINSLALSLLYGPTITSVHDYWKNHSFDYMDLCSQSDIAALICYLDLS